MDLKIYNTLSRKKEVFKPRHDKKVGMYVCGPTVYGPSHLGHARTYIAFDIIRRYLIALGYKVKFISNITDIHDDIINEVKKTGISFKNLTKKYINLYFKDLKQLQISRARYYPRVTAHIKEIIKLIFRLIKKGMAYQANDGSIYFDISKFKKYGRLSGIKLLQEKSGTRVNVDKYEKESISDFVLWKRSKNGISWPSPFGLGRPGWHIECSAISQKYLGDQFDIHGGSRDLIFPHHENEIAQSEAASNKSPFVKYWLHTGPLTVNGQKMSRSFKNYILIFDALKKYPAKILRLFFISAYWRSPIDYNKKVLKQTVSNYNKIKDFLIRLKNLPNKKTSTKIQKIINESHKNVFAALNDDFNTPKVLAEIFSFIKKINNLADNNKISRQDSIKIFKFFDELNKIFYIFPEKSELKTNFSEIKKLLKKREVLRTDKNWQEADKIRQKIEKLGYKIKDTSSGPIITKISI